MAPFNISELKGKVSAGRSNLTSRVDSFRAGAQPQRHPSAVAPSSPAPRPPPQRQTPKSTTAKVERFSAEDKDALFALFDSYFVSRRTTPAGSTSSPHIITPSPRTAPTPPSRNNTRPIVSAPISSPPASQIPDAASFSQFFSSHTSWAADSTWFDWDKLPSGQQPTPPLLRQRQDVIRATSWSSRGAQKVLHGVVLFEDLSIAWYHLTWQSSTPQQAIREAAWAPCPEPWIADDLQTSSAMYGDLVATFAERAMHERRHVGRGECWDLANEALKEIAITQQNVLPKVMPCIAHTHGHLIFSATAGNMGVWRGGDDAVRRGDIVQWLSVKIKLVGQPNVTMTLGLPDHTAIVVADSPISSLVADANTDEDGQALHPSAIGGLQVVEQSARELPTQRTYDMGQFLSGKVWIYRPVPMEAYLEIPEVAASWPPPVPNLGS